MRHCCFFSACARLRETAKLFHARAAASPPCFFRLRRKKRRAQVSHYHSTRGVSQRLKNCGGIESRGAPRRKGERQRAFSGGVRIYCTNVGKIGAVGGFWYLFFPSIPAKRRRRKKLLPTHAARRITASPKKAKRRARVSHYHNPRGVSQRLNNCGGIESRGAPRRKGERQRAFSGGVRISCAEVA